MNRNGRIVGGVLIGSALLLLLRAFGTVPFSDRTTNQVNQNQNQANAQTPPDRPLISDFNASRTDIASLNPGSQNPGDQNQGILNPNIQNPGAGSDNIAQNPGTGNTSGTRNTSGTGNTPGTNRPQTKPALPAAW
ncbi:MAG: hypothetical protein C4288_13680 [Leptolyngbya sp. ERB_1_1]